jgi:hypothetical protein
MNKLIAQEVEPGETHKAGYLLAPKPEYGNTRSEFHISRAGHCKCWQQGAGSERDLYICIRRRTILPIYFGLQER